MKNPIEHFGFDPKNYIWLYIGLIINILGYLLMIGGEAENPNVFNSDELFSETRITIAPLYIISGYIVMIFSIMKKTVFKDSNMPGTGWQLIAFVFPIAALIMFFNNRKSSPKKAQRYIFLGSLAMSIGLITSLLKLFFLTRI
jgi:hypothetical protein